MLVACGTDVCIVSDPGQWHASHNCSQGIGQGLSQSIAMLNALEPRQATGLHVKEQVQQACLACS